MHEPSVVSPETAPRLKQVKGAPGLVGAAPGGVGRPRDVREATAAIAKGNRRQRKHRSPRPAPPRAQRGEQQPAAQRAAAAVAVFFFASRALSARRGPPFEPSQGSPALGAPAPLGRAAVSIGRRAPSARDAGRPSSPRKVRRRWARRRRSGGRRSLRDWGLGTQPAAGAAARSARRTAAGRSKGCRGGCSVFLCALSARRGPPFEPSQGSPALGAPAPLGRAA
jgi:hypothetical protein